MAGEAPTTHELAPVLGALVKVLDDAGVTVGEELLNARPEPAAAAPTAAGPDPGHLARLIERIENRLAELEKDEPAPQEPAQ